MDKYIKIIKLSSDKVTDKNLEKLHFKDSETKLVLGYISPFLDFESIAKKIKSFFGEQTSVILSSTAGELCSLDNSAPYQPTSFEDGWDDIVLQSYSKEIIADIETHTVYLHNEDLKSGQNLKTPHQRVDEITQELEKLSINTEIDHKNTFAFTLIDGVSNSESFFVEAIYKSGILPCNLVGGSAGGKLDFKETFIFNNKEVVQNHAIINIIKLQPSVRFGIFKTQNFKRTKYSCMAMEADSALRYVKTIKRKDSDTTENIIDFLVKIFRCKEEDLEKKFNRFAFGIVANGEDYIRSVSSVDLEKRVVNFYCDIDFGDEVYLYVTNDFVKQTKKDFEKFMQNKELKPIAGLLNDCILRRLSNQDKLKDMDVFDDIPLVGFSTFGELLGVNINQTLTALFFFEAKEGEKFHDEYIDNFVQHYADFKNFFKERELNQLKSNEIKKSYKALENANKQLQEKMQELQLSQKKLVESEKMASLGGMVAGVAHEINTPVGMALTGATHLKEEAVELKRAYEAEDMSEEEFLDFLDSSQTLTKSIQLNLEKAANLVKSFKQVAVDQSSDENREFNLKEYIDEVLLSIHNQTKKTKHDIVVDIDNSIKIDSNPGALSQIVTNFIQNSIFHGFEGIEQGEIIIKAYTKEDTLILIYQDNGKGLSDEVKQKIFDPFFTTKRGSGGSGLGMNIVYNLITNKLKGSIDVESEMGNGVRFFISIDGCVVREPALMHE